MRISDWSSDVCSSDLDRTVSIHGVGSRTIVCHYCLAGPDGAVPASSGLTDALARSAYDGGGPSTNIAGTLVHCAIPIGRHGRGRNFDDRLPLVRQITRLTSSH